MIDNERQTIQAFAKNIRTLLNGQKYSIDFYQREYKWTTKQISELIVDLTTRFMEDHEDDDSRPREIVATYGHYFLGSIVISQKNGEKYIIDGQQRLTTLTLLLIYLNNIQRDRKNTVNISEMIFSEKFGKRSFNMDVPERTKAIDALFNQAPFDLSEAKESVNNIINRYTDINDLFPVDIKDDTLPYFIDWLIENVYLVEITAFSDEEAYTIFETMNDRGLSLSPADMLKGYLLANISSDDERSFALTTWKKRTNDLLDFGQEETPDFFKSWLRSQYADTIRERSKGAKPKDFDLLGTQFHRWVRENGKKIGINHSEDYYKFITRDLDFYSRQYILLRKCSVTYTSPFEDIYHISQLGFTLQYPCFLAPLKVSDSDLEVQQKVRIVSAYIEIMLSRRLWNWRSISYSTLQYTIFNLIKIIRGQTPASLIDILTKRLQDPDELSFVENKAFSMHKMNRFMIHRLLARMTDSIEKGAAQPSHYLEYINKAGDPSNPFEVEHIWANFPSRHVVEFPQSTDFSNFRNRVGGLLLLPKKFNASFREKIYEEKYGPYFHQNLLVASLNKQCYENNPGFLQFISKTGLNFQFHEHFAKIDQDQRQELYIKLAEYTWRPERLAEVLE